eukprot:6201824-Amphidinium_carterae.2
MIGEEVRPEDDPEARGLAENIVALDPRAPRADSRLPDSSAVSGLPDFIVLAKGKRPPVASPAGGAPLELASSVPAWLSLSLLADYNPDIAES